MLTIMVRYFSVAGGMLMHLTALIMGRQSDFSRLPDGKHILSQRTVPDSEFETYIMDADGSHVQRLTTVKMFLQNPVQRS